jgi:hypothetical protein
MMSYQTTLGPLLGAVMPLELYQQVHPAYAVPKDNRKNQFKLTIKFTTTLGNSDSLKIYI